MGPIQYAKHLFSGPRLPFTAAYFGSIALTLYFAVGVSSLPIVCFVYICFPPSPTSLALQNQECLLASILIFDANLSKRGRPSYDESSILLCHPSVPDMRHSFHTPCDKRVCVGEEESCLSKKTRIPKPLSLPLPTPFSSLHILSNILASSSLTNPFTFSAPIYIADTHILRHPTRGPHLVPRELFPNGKHRTAIRSAFRCGQGHFPVQ